MHFVYVLKAINNDRFYVGISENPGRRINKHNSGKTKSTKGYRPWILFFQEEFNSRTTARQREIYLKSGWGKKWIRKKWKRIDDQL